MRIVTEKSSFWNNVHFQVGFEVWGDGISATLNVQVPSPWRAASSRPSSLAVRFVAPRVSRKSGSWADSWSAV